MLIDEYKAYFIFRIAWREEFLVKSGLDARVDYLFRQPIPLDDPTYKYCSHFQTN